jgi:hypothetical protein
VDQPGVAAVPFSAKRENMTVPATTQLLNSAGGILDSLTEHGERRIYVVRQGFPSEQVLERQCGVRVLHRCPAPYGIRPHVDPSPAGPRVPSQDVVRALIEAVHFRESSLTEAITLTCASVR